MLLSKSTSVPAAAIDLAPVIDIVFLLLIFFLAATTFRQAERELAIVLPQTDAALPLTAALREIVINIDADGGVVVTGRRLAEGELAALIAAALRVNPEQRVSVRADRAAAYAHVAQVLDVLKAAGIDDPFLETTPRR